MHKLFFMFSINFMLCSIICGDLFVRRTRYTASKLCPVMILTKSLIDYARLYKKWAIYVQE